MGAIELVPWRFRRKEHSRYVWVTALSQGFAYAYHAFFGCFTLLTAPVWAFLTQKSRRELGFGVAAVAALSGAAFLNLSPSLIYVSERGANPGLQYKNIAESEVHALKLRHLFTPIPDNAYPPLRALERRVREAHFLGETENSTSLLGTVGGIGLLYLFGVALMACFGATVSPVAGAAAGLAIASVLLATTGGFSALFNVFVSPDIRAYIRIIAFISFFALAGLGDWLTRISREKISRAWAGVACVALALFASYDQAAVTRYLNYSARGKSFSVDREYVARPEAMIPTGGSVFELPFRDFPLDVPYLRMNVYDEAAPYIHLRESRCSWGAMSEREGRWNKETAAMPMPRMLARLTQQGFARSGLRRRWLPAAGVTGNGVDGALGAPLNSPDAQIGVLLTGNYAPTPDTPAEPGPLFVYYSTGFYPFVSERRKRWRWCGKVGRIRFSNPSGHVHAVQFSMMLKTGHAEAAPFHVCVAGEVERVMVSRRVPRTRTR
jgi:phosphoglycerol transferase